MADLFLLSEAHMRRMEPYFPLSRGRARVDDRRVLSGIIYVLRNRLMWRDAPPDHGPHKTLYDRFVRWSRMGGACQGSGDAQHCRKAGEGVFHRIFAGWRRRAAARPADAAMLVRRRTSVDNCRLSFWIANVRFPSAECG